MSSLTPFKGSGESFLTPLELSTTVASYQDSTTTDAGVTATLTPFTYTTISATQDHQSTKSIPFLTTVGMGSYTIRQDGTGECDNHLDHTNGGMEETKRREKRDNQVSLNLRSLSRLVLKSVDR